MPDTDDPIVTRPAEVTGRCFGCRSAAAIGALIVLDCGVLCCRECRDHRRLLKIPSGGGCVEVIG